MTQMRIIINLGDIPMHHHVIVFQPNEANYDYQDKYASPINITYTEIHNFK